MTKIKISTRQHEFLREALEHWVSSGSLSEDAATGMLADFEPAKTFSFIRVLTAIGSLLLGFGVLSFIASNWSYMDRPLKFAVILGFLLAFNGAGYLMRQHYPKTASALFYVAALIYGAGLFLVEQMFNFSTDPSQIFLLWSAGILPLALIRKDEILSILSLLAGFAWLMVSTFEMQQFPWLGFLVPSVFYLLQLGRRRLYLLFISNAWLLLWLLLGLNDLELLNLAVAFIFFGLGLCFLYSRSVVLSLQGNLLVGISGFFLTLPEIYDLSEKGASYPIPAILFAVGLGLFLLRRVQKGSLFAIALICALIIRYYVDLTYDFLPKSAFFIIGGLILLGFGYSFERSRRKGGANHEL